MSGMERLWRGTGASLLLVVTMGCVGTTNAAHQPAEFVDPTLDMLNNGIIHLDVNIDRATKRLEELKQFPDTQDTVLQVIRAMDVLGLELLQQQWVLQRNHLHFAKAQMIALKRNPDDKARLLQEWTTHEGSTGRMWIQSGRSGSTWSTSGLWSKLN
jgi:hypothetical protein